MSEQPSTASVTSKFTLDVSLFLRNMEMDQIGNMFLSAVRNIPPQNIVVTEFRIRGQRDDTPPETETPPPAELDAFNAAILAKDEKALMTELERLVALATLPPPQEAP